MTIAQIAYLLWEEAGKPEGRDLYFWLAAERIYKQRQRSGPEVGGNLPAF
jgi:hypothetical protein